MYQCSYKSFWSSREFPLYERYKYEQWTDPAESTVSEDSPIQKVAAEQPGDSGRIFRIRCFFGSTSIHWYFLVEAFPLNSSMDNGFRQFIRWCIMDRIQKSADRWYRNTSKEWNLLEREGLVKEWNNIKSQSSGSTVIGRKKGIVFQKPFPVGNT